MPCIATIPTAADLGITGRQERMTFECIARGGWYSLTDIKLYSTSRGCAIRETSISARIRDINKRLRPNDMKIRWRYKEKGSTDTIYSLVDL